LRGYIVERVSGQPFDDYLDAHLFKPLEMSHATFRQPLPAAFEADMSKGYALGSQPAKPYEIVIAAPAGSLAASSVDMAHFMIAHLEGGEYHGARILGAETLKKMHETPTDMIPPLNRMMLGFYEQNYNGHRIISQHHQLCQPLQTQRRQGWLPHFLILQGPQRRAASLPRSRALLMA
jgi:CubicO group peptidase (beta-lactamase class C family)